MDLGCDGKLDPEESRQYYWPIALFVIATAVYSLNLERAPHPDELYHILAARGILEFGEPRIAEGLYERVYWFTWMLSRVFAVFGDSLAVARMPSVLTMALLVALLYSWLRYSAGNFAANTGAILFAVSPFTVDIALFTRFYSLQALFFFCGAALLYISIEEIDKPRYRYILLASITLLCSVYLQPTTLIGVSGLGLWIVIRVGISWYQFSNSSRRVCLIAVLIVTSVAVVVAIWLGVFPRIWEMYRSVPLFNKDKSSQFWFYYVEYLKNYPSLWPAMGFLVISAIAYRPKPACFAVVVFGTSFLISSFAAAKSLRYIVYAQPFFYIIVGVGLASVGAPLWRWLIGLRTKLMAIFALPLSATANFGFDLVISLAALSLLVGNPSFGRTVAILSNYNNSVSQWDAVREEIEPWFERVDIVVTQSDLEMYYYYGEYDLLFSPSRLGENPGSVDFDPDYRTGKPIVGTLEGMATIFNCYPRGIFVTPKGRWRNPPYISTLVANLIAANTKPIDLPTDTNILAFTWNRDPSELECPGLPKSMLSAVEVLKPLLR